jgi:hypothetical protein
MRRRRNSIVFDLYVKHVQLREPRGGWRPWVADTTLPFDGYVRRLPWKPASWEASFSSPVRNRLTASAGWFLRLDVLLYEHSGQVQNAVNCG